VTDEVVVAAVDFGATSIRVCRVEIGDGPPRLEVLSSQHYINQGGSECVVYRVSPDAEVSGVQAGPNFFPGYPAGSDPNLRFALFAFAYNIPENSPLKVMARDGAGNEAVAGFWYKLFPKKFRSRPIPLDDGFLQKVVPEVMSHTPSIQDQGELIKTFLEINSKLRKANHDQIAELSRKSAPRFLWDGAFLQLSNSQVESLFADHRTYVYQGKEVDRQDHVGFDLSVTQQYPIEAANDGVILLADYFGIYGNTVLIDHGCGLISLYGHLSSIGVQPGQQVKKKDPVVGEAPPRPEADPTKPVISVIMKRDLGNRRFKPALTAVSSLLLFSASGRFRPSSSQRCFSTARTTFPAFLGTQPPDSFGPSSARILT